LIFSQKFSTQAQRNNKVGAVRVVGSVKAIPGRISSRIFLGVVQRAAEAAPLAECSFQVC
jgi:hypothetical protein